jgi:acetylglutamate kinase
LRLTVKLGGSVLEDACIRRSILGEIAGLCRDGHEAILVHGGGKSLSRRLGQLGIASRFVDGLRVTDAETLSVALMVLAGEVNKRLVAELVSMGAAAVGMCGADASSVRCRPMPEQYGFVGRPESVNRAFFDLLLEARLTPVVSSIAVADDAGLYNVNADQMAAACAGATCCSALVFLTDVAGLKDADGQVVPALGAGGIRELRAGGVITGGMLPKTASCLEAIEGNVPNVYIAPGATPGILRSVVQGCPAEGTRIHGKG